MKLSGLWLEVPAIALTSHRPIRRGGHAGLSGHVAFSCISSYGWISEWQETNWSKPVQPDNPTFSGASPRRVSIKFLSPSGSAGSISGWPGRFQIRSNGKR